jgi:hypothetical protein
MLPFIVSGGLPLCPPFKTCARPHRKHGKSQEHNDAAGNPDRNTVFQWERFGKEAGA